MGKGNIVYTYNGILFGIKKKELLSYATIWMNLEDVLLREIKRYKRQILPDSTYMWYIK